MSREATRGEMVKKSSSHCQPAAGMCSACSFPACQSCKIGIFGGHPFLSVEFLYCHCSSSGWEGVSDIPVRRLWPWRDISGCKTRDEPLLQVQNPQQERGQRGTAEEQRDRHRGALIRHSKEKAVKSPCYSPQSRVLHSPVHAVTHRTSP